MPKGGIRDRNQLSRGDDASRLLSLASAKDKDVIQVVLLKLLPVPILDLLEFLLE